MGDPNCYTCDYCLDNCTACPDGNITRLSNGQIDGGNLYTRGQGLSVLNSRRKRIWNQSRMSSSQGLLKRKSMMVSKQVGQGACPTALGEAGGPGDLQSAIQKSNYPPAIGRAAGYNMGHLHNRVAYRNNVGVDRKHDSYQRYLARRVGGVFRKEKMPNIVGRTSWRGQPRTRTGSKACCKRPTHSKVCEAICAQATIRVGENTIDDIYGYNPSDTSLTGAVLLAVCEDLTNLNRLTWTYNGGQGLDTFIVNFSQSITFSSIIIWDTNGNSITYQRGDGNTVENETTWTHQDTPTWIDTGVTIEVTLDGPCCDNRIPNCSDTSKFTGKAILLGGNVKNRTCVALRCQCPNCA